MNKKYSILPLLILVSVLSCNFIEDTTSITGLSGNTSLDLPISYSLSSVSRTLATDYGITVSSVTVTVGNDLFTYGPEVLTFDAATDVASGTIEGIVEGVYTVTLSAYMLDNDSNLVLVAEGIQADVSILAGQTTNVDISMSIVVGLGDLVVSGSIAQETILLQDDFEDGTLNKWTIAGRREGTYISEVILDNESNVAHIRHDDFSEINIVNNFSFSNTLNFIFDMKVNAVSDASSTSDFYARGAVYFAFLDVSGNVLGYVTYLYTTSSYGLTTSETNAKTEIVSTDWNSYNFSISELLDQIVINEGDIASVDFVFSGYTSGWPYNMHGEVWIDNVLVTE